MHGPSTRSQDALGPGGPEEPGLCSRSGLHDGARPTCPHALTGDSEPGAGHQDGMVLLSSRLSSPRSAEMLRELQPSSDRERSPRPSQQRGEAASKYLCGSVGDTWCPATSERAMLPWEELRELCSGCVGGLFGAFGAFHAPGPTEVCSKLVVLFKLRLEAPSNVHVASVHSARTQ